MLTDEQLTQRAHESYHEAIQAEIGLEQWQCLLDDWDAHEAGSAYDASLLAVDAASSVYETEETGRLEAKPSSKRQRVGSPFSRHIGAVPAAAVKSGQVLKRQPSPRYRTNRRIRRYRS